MGLENLFSAWREFRRGKRNKRDAREFGFNLEDNLFELHEELTAKTYRHSAYESFYVQDPKLRHIHKASVRDRVVHQAVFRVLYPIFDKGFIFDLYSCRVGKGTHRAVKRLEIFAGKLSKNYRETVFALKCDVRKFFNSVDQQVLTELIEKKVSDGDALRLIKEIIGSFEKTSGKGLPLGNVTSQLFANIYLNELDQFVKHQLKVRYYIRYCDDFVILGENKAILRGIALKIDSFLAQTLKLHLHENKLIIRKFSQGVDFLGYVALPHYRLLRTKTKRRIFIKLRGRIGEYHAGLIPETTLWNSFQSYLGVMSHADTRKLSRDIKNYFFISAFNL